MVFFDENKNRVEITKPKLIANGDEGRKIYYVQKDKCLKVYPKRALVDFDLGLQKDIQEMHLPNFMEIMSFLYDQNGHFRAELMPYYLDEDENILFKPTSYVVGNMHSIVSQFLTLAKEGIKTFDVHDGNVIKTRDKMVVIDTDLYCYSFSGVEAAKKNNMYSVSCLIHDMLLSACETLVSEGLLKKGTYFVPRPGQNINRTLDQMSEYDFPIDYVRYHRR